MSINTQINSKGWYEFFKALFNIYPDLKSTLSNELIMLDVPQLRYIIAAIGDPGEEALISLSKKSFSSEEDLAMLAKISKDVQLSNNIVETLLTTKMGKKIVPYLAENTTLSANDASFILATSTNPMVKNFVARNISDHTLLAEAKSSKDLSVLEGLLYNRNLNSEEIDIILGKLKLAAPAILAASRNANTPYDFLLDWSKSKDTAVQRTLATNPAIPYEIQDILSSNADERTLINLARNPVLDIDIQNRFLASLYTDTVRFALAENENLQNSVAIQIFNSEIAALRAFSISKSQIISPSILAQLAADEENKEVIKAIGSHPNALQSTWDMMINRALRLGFRIDCFFLVPKDKDSIKTYGKYISEERKYLLSLQEAQIIKKQYVHNSNQMDYFARSVRLYQNKKLEYTELLEVVSRLFTI